jgi:hypothetical protein
VLNKELLRDKELYKKFKNFAKEHLVNEKGLYYYDLFCAKDNGTILGVASHEACIHALICAIGRASMELQKCLSINSNTLEELCFLEASRIYFEKINEEIKLLKSKVAIEDNNVQIPKYKTRFN